MYLSEEKRALIRTCIENRSATAKTPLNHHPSRLKKQARQTEPIEEAAHILFHARSGNEIFTPF